MQKSAQKDHTILQMINDSIIQKKYKFFLEHCKNSSSATFLEKKIKKRKVFAERVVKQTT